MLGRKRRRRAARGARQRSDAVHFAEQRGLANRQMELVRIRSTGRSSSRRPVSRSSRSMCSRCSAAAIRTWTTSSNASAHGRSRTCRRSSAIRRWRRSAWTYRPIGSTRCCSSIGTGEGHQQAGWHLEKETCSTPNPTPQLQSGRSLGCLWESEVGSWELPDQHVMNRREALRGLLALPLSARLSQQSASAAACHGRMDASVQRQGSDRLGDVPGQAARLGSFPRGGPRDAKGEHVNRVGVDTDPRAVFSVVADGRQAIRISGEIYGALTTRAAFENYHLRFQFKWGEKRWPPREDKIRDSGCCYHAVPPHGASYGFWMRPREFHIQEGECGDFYSLAGAIVDAEATPQNPVDPKSEYIYKRGASDVTGHTKRLIRIGGLRTPARRVEHSGTPLSRPAQRPPRQRPGGHAALGNRQPTPGRRSATDRWAKSSCNQREPRSSIATSRSDGIRGNAVSPSLRASRYGAAGPRTREANPDSFQRTTIGRSGRTWMLRSATGP